MRRTGANVIPSQKAIEAAKLIRAATLGSFDECDVNMVAKIIQTAIDVAVKAARVEPTAAPSSPPEPTTTQP